MFIGEAEPSEDLNASEEDSSAATLSSRFRTQCNVDESPDEAHRFTLAASMK